MDITDTTDTTENRKYNDLLENYNKTRDSIMKYMFIDIDNQRKIIDASGKELNKFIKKIFNKVYVLNGKINIVKYYQMMEKLLLENIDFEFFDTQETESPISYLQYLQYEHKQSIPYNTWCFLITLKNLINTALSSNTNCILVLDNNACFNTNLHGNLKFNTEIYTKWEMIIFDTSINICDLKSFSVKKSMYCVLLDKIELILNSGDIDNGIINKETTNILTINNCVKSDITQNDIDTFRQKLLGKNKNIYYMYPHDNQTYNVSVSYANMLLNFENYYNYLHDKKVALIGPSPSIRKTQNGKYIDDNYDVIVKINNAIFFCEEPEFYGERIDILYTLSIAQDLKQKDLNPKYSCFQEYFYERIKELNIKYVVFSLDLHNQCHSQWLSLHILRMSESYNIHNVPTLFLDYNSIHDHIDMCKKIPSAGFGSILNLIKYETKELFIKGFSFFKDGHVNSYIGKDWQKKIEKANTETKHNITEENKEKVIHSLVQNSFSTLAPHHFDYEYKRTIEFGKIYKNIIFDESIKNLFV